jgi:hypothetical protein
MEKLEQDLLMDLAIVEDGDIADKDKLAEFNNDKHLQMFTKAGDKLYQLLNIDFRYLTPNSIHELTKSTKLMQEIYEKLATKYEVKSNS